MKIIKRVGYGVLSIVTVFFYTLTNGFAKYRGGGIPRSGVNRGIKNNERTSPEGLILSLSNGKAGNNPLVDASHTSHRSHRSHSSHRSGTTGTTRTNPTKPKPTNPNYVASDVSGYINPYASYLTSFEVGRVVGQANIQQTTEPFILHFFRQDQTEILRVTFAPKSNFESFRQDSRFTRIVGIGESALIGTEQLPIQLVFMAGDHCVTLTTFIEEGLQLYLSLEQMKSAARIISSKL